MSPALTRLFLTAHRMAYVLLDARFAVLGYGGDHSLLHSTPQSMAAPLAWLEQADWLTLMPELAGCEDILSDVLNGLLPQFELEQLNRTQANGETRYLTLNVLRYPPLAGPEACLPDDVPSNPPLLLVTLNDISDWTCTQQVLTQQRNELRLLQASLDDTNKRLEFIMQRYVPKEVARALMENRILPDLGGEARTISAIFVDLRNYTGLSEQLSPSETIDMLHVFLEVVCSAIVAEGGVVVNYMGDAVMAIFNAPDAQNDHAWRAVRAGLRMQATALTHTTRSGKLLPPLHYGVGINTGPALVGNIGALQHYQYTAVGDSINVASRICSQAQAGEVLIGPNTHAVLAGCIHAQALPPMMLKGKRQVLTIYRVDSLCETKITG